MFDSEKNRIVHNVFVSKELDLLPDNVDNNPSSFEINVDSEDTGIHLRQLNKFLIKQSLFVRFKYISPIVLNLIVDTVLAVILAC
jgi:hypothetical protein